MRTQAQSPDVTDLIALTTMFLPDVPINLLSREVMGIVARMGKSRAQ